MKQGGSEEASVLMPCALGEVGKRNQSCRQSVDAEEATELVVL